MRDRARQCLEDMLENARIALCYRDEDREGWRDNQLRVDAGASPRGWCPAPWGWNPS